MRFETKVKRFLQGKTVTLSGEEIHKGAKQGFLCGVVGCPIKPKWKCPRCGTWYCGIHKNMHIDIA